MSHRRETRLWMNLPLRFFGITVTIKGLTSTVSRSWRMAHADGQQIKAITREHMPVFFQFNEGISGWGLYLQVWPFRVEIERVLSDEETTRRLKAVLGRETERPPNVVPFNRR